MNFVERHIGPSEENIQVMLKTLSLSSLDQLVSKTIPSQIRIPNELSIPEGLSEVNALKEISQIVSKNKVYRSFIGLGYYGTHTPAVIQRNILENPSWYTQYTPYQAEISQGRLEALLNYQTMICDLTGMDVANASLLDEGTAAAEAMTLAYRIKGSDNKNKFLVSCTCLPQTIDVVKNRAAPLGLNVVITDPKDFQIDDSVFGALVQYPDVFGEIQDYSAISKSVTENNALMIAATDLLALTLLKSPAEWGAHISLGNSQRFGVPFGFGGPHAAFFAVKDEFKRQMPGRLIGVSKDALGNPGFRLTLQTREQHIRREKATSNICTAQVLLAIMASMYAVFHGPKRIREMAVRVAEYTASFAAALISAGLKVKNKTFFDTVTIECSTAERSKIIDRARAAKVNINELLTGTLSVSLDETVTEDDLQSLIKIFTDSSGKIQHLATVIPTALKRIAPILTHSVFNSYHSETEFLRYVTRLQSKDLSLANSMIPLGSCTMKLNATAEMIPVTWPEINSIHPFAPREQTLGYMELISQLEKMLCTITGFYAASIQPNAGSQGEYAGLLAIRAYHLSRGDTHRNICLIPDSAHGTNPASAALAGMKVIAVACDEMGNVNLADLKERAQEHSVNLAALMVTYPSTHGVFEEAITEISKIIHDQGGQVYMDGANLNAQVGLCSPEMIGADVCHINLHKTFCIPHGGGGPGVGPVVVRKHLAEFLPGHRFGINDKKCGPVSAAPWGSASILVIPWVYIKMMGGPGLKKATQVAILNANYIATRLEPHYPVLYRGKSGMVAHECILDLRGLKQNSGIEVEDVAKRLMDYSFHAPTVSFPVPGTLMIEPTESEALVELDRFCDAMISIRNEIRAIEEGKADKVDNLLKNAPHSLTALLSNDWKHPYTREVAAYPVAGLRNYKFWPPVSRVDNVYGDRNLVCSCGSISDYK